jgi:hypothetical protein
MVQTDVDIAKNDNSKALLARSKINSESKFSVYQNNEMRSINRSVISLRRPVMKRSLSNDSFQGQIFSKNRNTVRIYETVPKQFQQPLHITNQAEAKQKFLESNIPPVLKFKGNERVIQNIMDRHSKPSFKHFFIARNILELIKFKFGTNTNKYYEENFGKRIDSKQCISYVGKYLEENNISGEISINFAPGLTCSGMLVSHQLSKTRPEARKFVVWINGGTENQFLREAGIVCLCDHEIGTHYYRAFNEGINQKTNR